MTEQLQTFNPDEQPVVAQRTEAEIEQMYAMFEAKQAEEKATKKLARNKKMFGYSGDAAKIIGGGLAAVLLYTGINGMRPTSEGSNGTDIAIVNNAAGSTESAKSPEPTATAKPTETPSATPEASASASPEASAAPKLEDFPLSNGEFMEVFPGDLISGDVSMSDTQITNTADLAEVNAKARALYDSDLHKQTEIKDVAKTALFVDVQAHGWVYAENGGFVKRGLTGQERQTTLTFWRAQKINSGFDTADVVTWTGKDSTTDQAGLLFNGQAGTVNPENGTQANLSSVKAEEAIALLQMVKDSNLDLSLPINRQLVLDLLKCIACENTCSTPEVPVLTPKPTETPNTECKVWEDTIMKTGEKKTFEDVYGFTALGDDWISINGGTLKRYYDDIDYKKTKAVERKWFGQPTDVTIWSKVGGTDFKGFSKCATKDDWVKQVADDIKETLETTKAIDKKSLK